MTLVEVVLGLALMATLLVGILLTRARFMRQSMLAQRRSQAVVAADALLTQWWSAKKAIPSDARGEVVDCPGLMWRTTPVSNETARSLRARVVRLEMFDSEHDQSIVCVEVLAGEGESQ